MKAGSRAEVDHLTTSTPTWQRMARVLVATLAPFGDAARAVAAKLRADRSAPFSQLAREIEARVQPTARIAPDFAMAFTPEARSLVCADILASGEWRNATASKLAAAWGVDRGAVANYRRAAHAVLAATGLDLEEKLTDTLAHLTRMQEENEEQARVLEAQSDHDRAVSYRTIALNARARFAEVAGLLVHKISFSLEADPRVAGMYQAILAALADRDRQEDEQRRVVLAIVERLNGGALPADFPEALPSVRDHVRDAVKRYEAEIGARQLPSKP